MSCRLLALDKWPLSAGGFGCLPQTVTPMGLGRAVPPRGPGWGSHRANKPSRGLWIFAIIVQLQLQGPRRAAKGLRPCQEVEVPGQH